MGHVNSTKKDAEDNVISKKPRLDHAIVKHIPGLVPLWSNQIVQEAQKSSGKKDETQQKKAKKSRGIY